MLSLSSSSSVDKFRFFPRHDGELAGDNMDVVVVVAGVVVENGAKSDGGWCPVVPLFKVVVVGVLLSGEYGSRAFTCSVRSAFLDKAML